jgi:putative FmdB family regulatory protein
MPIYEYECETCKNRVEEIEKMSSDPKRELHCARCRGVMRRVISQGTFQLKGGGWYKDGYAATSSIPKGPSSPSDAGPVSAEFSAKPKAAKKE